MRVFFLIVLSFAVACTEQGTVELGSRFLIEGDGDFGDVGVGSLVLRPFTLQNTGDAEVVLREFELGAGFDTDRYLFEVANRPSSIPPRGAVRLSVTFRPFMLMDEAAASSFTVRSDFESVTAEVRGRGVVPVRVDPELLDFGSTLRGSPSVKQLRITSFVDTPLVIEPSDVDSDGAFSVSPTVIDSFATGQIDVTYLPSERSEDRGDLLIRTCQSPLCEKSVPLRGRGHDNVLTCEPQTVDFGERELGETGVVRVGCFVVTNDAVDVVRAELRGVSENELTLAPMLPVRIEPAQTISFDLAWTPATNVDLSARLVLHGVRAADRRPVAPVELELLGRGGKPLLVVEPESLDFGRVALGTYFRRTIVLRNLGTRPAQIRGATRTPVTFSIPPGVARSIEPGASHEVVVEFRPALVGAVSGELLFDSDAGLLRVALAGEGIELEPCSSFLEPIVLDFGSVELFRERDAALWLTNVGATDCLFQGFELGGAGAFELDSPGEIMLAPAESAAVRVRYRPEHAAFEQTRLTFYSSDPLASTVAIDTSGLGVIGAPIIYPDAINFANVAIGCTSDARTVRISNPDATSRTITRAELTPESSADFTLGGTQIFPLEIPPRSSLELSLTYTPSGPGIDLAVLEINDVYRVPIFGTGDAAGVAVEQVTQLSAHEVDVLFVIDGSCSTTEEIEAFAANLPSLVAPADALGTEYQLAVIDTTHDDGFTGSCVRHAQRPAGYIHGQCGYFSEGDGFDNPAWRIITRDEQPSPQAAFQGVGTFPFCLGSGFEQPYENALAALRAPLLEGWNAGFLRRDAALAVVYLTNELEQSPSAPPIYIDDFLAVRGIARRASASMHAIAGDPLSGCTGMSGTADPGDALIEAPLATGGVFESVCSGDWATTAANIGTAIFGFRTSYGLENRPAPATLEVIVDGVSIPSGQNAWSYNETTNRVVFSPLSVPDEGSDIRFSYQTMCR